MKGLVNQSSAATIASPSNAATDAAAESEGHGKLTAAGLQDRSTVASSSLTSANWQDNLAMGQSRGSPALVCVPNLTETLLKYFGLTPFETERCGANNLFEGASIAAMDISKFQPEYDDAARRLCTAQANSKRALEVLQSELKERGIDPAEVAKATSGYQPGAFSAIFSPKLERLKLAYAQADQEEKRAEILKVNCGDRLAQRKYMLLYTLRGEEQFLEAKAIFEDSALNRRGGAENGIRPAYSENLGLVCHQIQQYKGAFGFSHLPKVVNRDAMHIANTAKARKLTGEIISKE